MDHTVVPEQKFPAFGFVGVLCIAWFSAYYIPISYRVVLGIGFGSAATLTTGIYRLAGFKNGRVSHNQFGSGMLAAVALGCALVIGSGVPTLIGILAQKFQDAIFLWATFICAAIVGALQVSGILTPPPEDENPQGPRRDR